MTIKQNVINENRTNKGQVKWTKKEMHWCNFCLFEVGFN